MNARLDADLRELCHWDCATRVPLGQQCIYCEARERIRVLEAALRAVMDDQFTPGWETRRDLTAAERHAAQVLGAAGAAAGAAPEETK